MHRPDSTANRGLLKWIDDLIIETEKDAKRFDTVDQRNEVLAIYRTARTHYLA
jgi:hypothetical protein